MKIAIITGASRGLGLAVAHELAQRGWGLVLTARAEQALAQAANSLPSTAPTVVLAGDVASAAHRQALVDAAEKMGGLDLLINNASDLGPGPEVHLNATLPENVASLFQVNVFAPLDLMRLAQPMLSARRGQIINISSDAALGPYPGWGAYGATKAALDQISNVFGAEHEELRVHAVDPGEMQTAMLAQAFPEEDLSDRNQPSDVAATLMELIEGNQPSGRIIASSLQHQGA